MSAPAAIDLEGTRVLVVDDDADNREMLALTLEHCGVRVTTASSAAEALRAIEQEQPQVLISDIGLPGEDGFTLLKKIRALPPGRGGNVPAIALTGRDGQEVTQAGFQLHLTKPVVAEAVMAAIVSLLQAT